MDDLTGLSKVVETEIAKSTYRDTLAEAARETGKALTDTAKAARLFLAPIQLLAAAQDRFARWLTRITNEVPEDRQVEAPANIAGPAIQALMFLEEGDALAEMYLNLLRKAIDKEEQDKAHPAFVRIIEQLSPDEAVILYLIGSSVLFVDIEIATTKPSSEWVWYLGSGNTMTGEKYRHVFPTGVLKSEKRLNMYLRHLHALNLLDDYHDSRVKPPIVVYGAADAFTRSEFGSAFVQACIPNGFSSLSATLHTSVTLKADARSSQ